MSYTLLTALQLIAAVGLAAIVCGGFFIAGINYNETKKYQ